MKKRINLKSAMLKRTIVLLVGMCLMMSLGACQSNRDAATQQQNETTFREGYSRYQNGIFGFSVEFPATWFCESEPYYYATKGAESSPDSGVKIYIDSQKEDYIRVYGQHGQITTNFVVQSNYKKTDLDENRELYVSETGDFYTAQLFFKDNKHISATINMSANVYKEHEDEIMSLLKSINY